MNYPKKVTHAVAEDFERKRADRENLRLVRLNQVYSLCPEIAEIDKALSNVGSEIVKATLMGKEDINERISAIREKNLAMQERRAALLIDLGFDKDYTEPPYECDKCNDTGYLGVKLCSCYKNALILKAYESSGLGNLLKKQSFENFSLDSFEGDEKLRIQQNYNILSDYADKLDCSSPSIILVGGTGLGKTHLSTAVARKLIYKGYDVVYETAQNIFTDFDRDRFLDRFGGEEPVSYKYLDCDLLIIDDLGSEMVSTFSISCLYNILNTRLNKGKPIIISTNLTGNEVQRLYQDRITSRLFGEFLILPFTGTDYRRKKLKNN